MKTISIDLPTLYGDHHVIEVRRILLEMPGVQDVYASSSFQVVEVSFDPEKVSEEAIKAKLDEAGYMGELSFPAEAGTAASVSQGNGVVFFRHTAVYETSRKTVSFAQNVNYSGRPLWPCPGIGTVKTVEE